MRHLLAIAASALIVSTVATSALARTWTDTQGNRTEAKFVRMHQGQVVLSRGARVLTVPYEKFSLADQQYLKAELKKRGQEYLIPDAPAVAPSASGSGQSALANSNPPVPAAPPSGFGIPRGMSSPSSPPQTYSSSQSQVAASIESQASISPRPQYSSSSYSPPQPSPASYTPPAMPQFSGSSSSNSGGGYQPSSSSMPESSSYTHTPSMPEVPQMEMREYKQCMKCNKEVPAHSKAGDKCPHCKVTWDAEQGEDGVYRDASGNRISYRKYGKIAGLVIFALAALFKLIKRD